ncbi:MAG: hypothetical protein LC122_14210 [Chitinophagales bacterium]|nr:hypothetical protein [Chitinophagales bacterium]
MPNFYFVLSADANKTKNYLYICKNQESVLTAINKINSNNEKLSYVNESILLQENAIMYIKASTAKDELNKKDVINEWLLDIVNNTMLGSRKNICNSIGLNILDEDIFIY